MTQQAVLRKREGRRAGSVWREQTHTAVSSSRPEFGSFLKPSITSHLLNPRALFLCVSVSDLFPKPNHAIFCDLMYPNITNVLRSLMSSRWRIKGTLRTWTVVTCWSQTSRHYERLLSMNDGSQLPSGANSFPWSQQTLAAGCDLMDGSYLEEGLWLKTCKF